MADSGTPDGTPGTIDTPPAVIPDASFDIPVGMVEPSIDANDVGADTGASEMGQPAIDMNTMIVKAGTSGVLEFGVVRVMVRSMTFDQNVQLTITVVDAPGPGPVGKTFQVQQAPIEAHASAALRFQVTLTSTQAAPPGQYLLANFKPKLPVGMWIAPTGQLYDDATRTLTADFFGLDKGPVVFALLQTCTDVTMCGALQRCTAQLCQ